MLFTQQNIHIPQDCCCALFVDTKRDRPGVTPAFCQCQAPTPIWNRWASTPGGRRCNTVSMQGPHFAREWRAVVQLGPAGGRRRGITSRAVGPTRVLVRALDHASEPTGRTQLAATTPPPHHTPPPRHHTGSIRYLRSARRRCVTTTAQVRRIADPVCQAHRPSWSASSLISRAAGMHVSDHDCDRPCPVPHILGARQAALHIGVEIDSARRPVVGLSVRLVALRAPGNAVPDPSWIGLMP